MTEPDRFTATLIRILRRETSDHMHMAEAVVWAMQEQAEFPPRAGDLADDIEDYLGGAGWRLEESVARFTSDRWRQTVRAAIEEALD